MASGNNSHDEADEADEDLTGGTSRRTFLRALGAGGALATLGATGVESAAALEDPQRYRTVVLTGAAEVPSVDSRGRGRATFSLNDAATELEYRLTVANIDDVTAAHVHRGGPDENGPPVATLFDGPTTDGRQSGVLATGRLTESDLQGPLAERPFQALVDDLEAGDAYVNVHTTAYPDGEIRGQFPDQRSDGRAGRGRGGSGSITFLHDTHVHGTLSHDEVDAADYFGLMRDVVGENPNAVRVGNGDDLASSVLSSVFDGVHVVDAFNAGNLAYDTFGNHDFDMGPEVLRQQVAESHFTWVSANMRDPSGEQVFAADAGAAPFVVHEVGGLDVGITGLINEEAPEITSLGDNTVVPVDEAMREVAPQMRAAGADIVVVLSHLSSPVARDLARNVDGIDAIVGDHAAQVLEEPEVINDTVLSFVGDSYEYLGELTLDVVRGSVAAVDFTLHDVAEATSGESFEPSQAVGNVQSFYEEGLDAALGEVVGELESGATFDTRRSTVRTEEANSGNYVADAKRAVVDADVGLMNGGGIRTDTLYEGPLDVSKRLVFDILPFGNTVVKLEVTGQKLHDALENGVSGVANLEGRFPQVSGLSFAWTPSAPVGERVDPADVTVGGSALDLDATYTLATNNFVAGGGDGYAMFTDVPRQVGADDGPLLATVVVDAVEADGTIAPTTEGRITEN
ncbi:5'-nucleotidase C-terminal domain-containing protein [Salinigranum sp.]|uniref:5'-nucleotidase C-terminal domain-containing protein n=1 Tax=Salinigranum sp. TaxID=1966351 RepID=UPI00356AB882